jgi:hypothetical protein
MSQVIKCANSRRIKLEKERLVHLKRRKIQQRCRINRFKKLMLRRRKFFFCILMNLTSHSVNREIWVKPRGTDIYNDILNWTPHVVNIRISQQTFNHICDQLRTKIQKRTTKLRSSIHVGKRIVVTVWRLATNIEFRTLGHLFGINRGQPVLFFMKL